MRLKLHLLLFLDSVLKNEVCVAPAACVKDSGRVVVDGCRQSFKDKSSIIYLDTGTGPNSDCVRCMCEINIALAQETIRLDANYRTEETTDTLEINDVLLDRTKINASVSLAKRTTLWITAGGIGGVCVTLSAVGNIGVSCFSNVTRIVCGTSSTSSLSKSSVCVTGQKEAVTSTQSLDTTTSSTSTKVNITGPVAGGVSGFVFLTLVVILTVVYRKRRKNHKKERKHRGSDFPSPEDEYDYTTENPMYERATDDGNPVSSQNQTIIHIPESSGRQKHDITEDEYHYVTNIYDTSTTAKKMRQADMPEYSTVNKQFKKANEDLQKLEPGNDVYDRADDRRLAVGSNEYYRLGLFSGKDKTFNSEGN